MANCLVRIFVSFLIVSVLVTIAESNKYTSKELEELRRFYYDDEYDDTSSSKTDYDTETKRKTTPSSRRRPSESRSSSNPDSKKHSNEKTSDDDRVVGPGELFKDARKYLEAGRKAIDNGVKRILPPPPPLPRIRMIRSGDKTEFKMDFKRDTRSGSEEADKDEGELEYVEREPRIRISQNESESKERGRSGIFKNPFERLQNSASQAAADTGGRILHILNRLTPPPSLKLPTPIPNLEDFGG